jgi:hypothetical protein
MGYIIRIIRGGTETIHSNRLFFLSYIEGITLGLGEEDNLFKPVTDYINGSGYQIYYFKWI